MKIYIIARSQRCNASFNCLKCVINSFHLLFFTYNDRRIRSLWKEEKRCDEIIIPIMIAVVYAMEKGWHHKDKNQGSAIYARGHKLGPCRRTPYKFDTTNYWWYNPYSMSCYICYMFYRSRNICLIRACSWIHPFYPVNILTYFILQSLIFFYCTLLCFIKLTIVQIIEKLIMI